MRAARIDEDSNRFIGNGLSYTERLGEESPIKAVGVVRGSGCRWPWIRCVGEGQEGVWLGGIEWWIALWQIRCEKIFIEVNRELQGQQEFYRLSWYQSISPLPLKFSALTLSNTIIASLCSLP